MTRRKGYLLLACLLLCLFLLPGCNTKAPVEASPASFTAGFAAEAGAGDEKALDAYRGGSYQLNAKVEAVLPDHIVIQCTDRARIHLYLPQEELQGLQVGDVAAFEGTVKELDVKKFGDMSHVTMTMEPASFVGDVFEITGEVEAIFHDWDRDGQDYIAMMDDSVAQGKQVNIYLPEGHGFQEGDMFSARGVLAVPVGYQGGGLSVSEDGAAESFVMYEPDSLQKAGSKEGES